MNARIGLASVLAVASTMVFPLAGQTGRAAAPDIYAGGHFSFTIGATPAFLADVEGGHVQADVVNPQSPNTVFSRAICRVVVVFYDAKGTVIQSSELSVGPGETGSVELASGNAPPTNPPSPLRATFHVLDDGSGPPKPCLAIPSVQLVDGKALRTTVLIPAIIG